MVYIGGKYMENSAIQKLSKYKSVLLKIQRSLILNTKNHIKIGTGWH